MSETFNSNNLIQEFNTSTDLCVVQSGGSESSPLLFSLKRYNNLKKYTNKTFLPLLHSTQKWLLTH